MANEQARSLRKRMTPQEVKLWVQLRQLREMGYHFRRQSPRQGYIVDFVCLKKKLVVEVDGGQHGRYGHAIRDRERDTVLRDREGFRVLRVWNNDVDRNLRGVVDAILGMLSEQPGPAPSPPPHPGDP
jgi:very-short-patch-repair endonuclease